MNLPSISIVTWDGGFRESYHTVDSVQQIDYPHDRYDFTWVEYYNELNPVLGQKLDASPNCQGLCLNGEGQWHVGRRMNTGIAATRGDLLVLIDGDVVLEPDMLHRVAEAHAEAPTAAIYVRRWDESPQDHNGTVDLTRLCERSELTVATNFGGCLIAPRTLVAKVGGYEEHADFAGPGMINGELAVRLRNTATPIIWHQSLRVYHPWHAGTRPTTDTPAQRRQAWVTRCRDLAVDCRADPHRADEYLKDFKTDASDNEHQSAKGVLRRLRRILRPS